MQDFNLKSHLILKSSKALLPRLVEQIHDFADEKTFFVASKDYFSELDDQLENILDGDLPDEAEVRKFVGGVTCL